MIRKFGAALTGLALSFPLMVAAPVAAHTSGGLVIDFDSWQNGAETWVAGTVTNHTSARVSNINLTATFKTGTTVIDTQTGATLIGNVAPHSVTPFLLIEDTDVTAADSTTVAATYNNTVQAPAGGIDVDEGTLVANVYSGTVTNNSGVAATNLVVYATRSDGTGFEDAKGSAVIANLAAGASTTYTITFAAAGDGTTVENLIAQTTSGTYLTSWNNYFNDLGKSDFVDEVAYLAAEGITLGCGANRFCPNDSVTREQMAAFIDRALDLTDTGTDYFEDDETSFAEQSINNIRAVNITTGCTDATHFCPTGKVTREQMAAFLDRGYAFPTDNTDYFTDDNTSFAEQNIQDMRGANVTTGCTATTFCPTKNVTREQMAAFLFRAEAWQAAQVTP